MGERSTISYTGRMAQPIERPCPSCIDEGRGLSRIGNHRAKCRLCNSFARRLERSIIAELKRSNSEAYAELREATETRLYKEITKGSTP